jgi:hypothetical protein
MWNLERKKKRHDSRRETIREVIGDQVGGRKGGYDQNMLYAYVKKVTMKSILYNVYK